QLLPSANLPLKQFSDDGPEEKPPELQNALEVVQAKRLQIESRIRQKLCRLSHGHLRLRCHSPQRLALENPNPQFRARLPCCHFCGGFCAVHLQKTHGILNYSRNAQRIAWIRPLQYVEQNPQVAHRTCHRAYHAQPSKSAVA